MQQKPGKFWGKFAGLVTFIGAGLSDGDGFCHIRT